MDQLDEMVGMIQDGRVKLGDLGEVTEKRGQGEGETQKPAPADTPAATTTETPAAVVPEVEPEDGLAVPGQRPNNLKLPVGDDPLAFQTASIYKERKRAGKPVTFGEAEALARTVLGLEASPPAQDKQREEETNPGDTVVPETSSIDTLPANIADTNARIKQLNKDKAVKAAAFDFEGAADIENQITDLTEHRENLRLIEQTTRASEQNYSQTWTHAANAAAEALKEHGSGDPDSALSIIAGNIQSNWIAAKDERLSDPAKAPGLIYAAACEKLGIKPGAPNQASAHPPTSEVSPVKPATRPMSPAQALLSSGSPAGLPVQRPGVDLTKITNAHDLDSLIASGQLQIVE